MNSPVQSLCDTRLKLNAVEAGIISALVYFDIFKYPLTRNQLIQFCHYPVSNEEGFDKILNDLLEEQLIFLHEEFYFLSDASIIERRKNGNILAEKFYPVAKKYSTFISKFPFVKAVFISGSLSKGFMDEHSDIDYFIITQPGRLWLCRTLLILYKKIFLLNSHKYFCVNYFIDQDNLEIPDKNLFTATELLTLIPMVNFTLFMKLMSFNNWTKNFLPNHSLDNEQYSGNNSKPVVKILFEKIFSGSFGKNLDRFCLSVTLKYWKKKFPHFSEEDFNHALRSRKNVSKHHPNKFQEKVLALYSEKLNQFEKKHNVIIERAFEVSTLFQ